jgi:hypothetical protein
MEYLQVTTSAWQALGSGVAKAQAWQRLGLAVVYASPGFGIGYNLELLQ